MNALIFDSPKYGVTVTIAQGERARALREAWESIPWNRNEASDVDPHWRREAERDSGIWSRSTEQVMADIRKESARTNDKRARVKIALPEKPLVAVNPADKDKIPLSRFRVTTSKYIDPGEAWVVKEERRTTIEELLRDDA